MFRRPTSPASSLRSTVRCLLLAVAICVMGRIAPAVSGRAQEAPAIRRLFIAPNQNTGNPVATDTEWKTANQTVFHDAEHPSRVVLPVITSR